MNQPCSTCGRRHRTYSTLARCRWSRAEWVRGDGRWALLAHCDVLTVALHPTLEGAEKERAQIDRTGCGHACSVSGRRHEIVDLDAA
jgi:hypothetical protein